MSGVFGYCHYSLVVDLIMCNFYIRVWAACNNSDYCVDDVHVIYVD